MTNNGKFFFQMLIKWLFTCSIAAIPSIFSYVKGIITFGWFAIENWGLSGELFILSIVMTAEPLWELYVLKNKNIVSLLLLSLIIFFLLIAAYLYSLSPHGFNLNEMLDTKSIRDDESFTNLLGRLSSLSRFCLLVAITLSLFSFMHVMTRSEE